MASKLVIKTVAGAVALGLGSTAFASGINPGDLLLNIVDYSVSNGTETSSTYLFDTNISLASFVGTDSYSFDLSSDPNFSSSLLSPGNIAGAPGSVDYSVIAGTQVGSGRGATWSVDFTSNTSPPNNNQQSDNTTAALRRTKFLSEPERRHQRNFRLDESAGRRRLGCQHR